MGQQSKLLMRKLRVSQSSSAATVFRLASRYADLLIAPWLLEGSALFAYVAARLVSLCLPFSLSVLGRKASPQLVSMAQAHHQRAFRAAAARINLGYLMICGAMAVLVITAAPLLAKTLNVADVTFDNILIWLVIGQSAPVVFGATSLLMDVVDRRAFYDLLMGVTAVIFLIGVNVIHASEGIVLAQTFAAAQLTQAAVCALLLTQCGVWPGLTALLQKEIRVF